MSKVSWDPACDGNRRSGRASGAGGPWHRVLSQNFGPSARLPRHAFCGQRMEAPITGRAAGRAAGLTITPAPRAQPSKLYYERIRIHQVCGGHRTYCYRVPGLWSRSGRARFPKRLCFGVLSEWLLGIRDHESLLQPDRARWHFFFSRTHLQTAPGFELQQRLVCLPAPACSSLPLRNLAALPSCPQRFSSLYGLPCLRRSSSLLRHWLRYVYRHRYLYLIRLP